MVQTNEVVNLIGDIKSLIEQDFENLQGWTGILAWPIGETRIINGTYNTKIYQDSQRAKFLTRMPPETEFDDHWHDCLETCNVLCNVLVDKVTGNTWKEGERAVFQKGANHIPENPSKKHDTYLEVIFNR